MPATRAASRKAGDGAAESGGRGAGEIEVADNGVGIPAENLTRIFSQGFSTRRAGTDSGCTAGLSPKNFKEEAVGYITDIYFNSATGWYDAKFIITDDGSAKLINNGWSVSCSFDVLRIQLAAANGTISSTMNR